MEKQGCWTKVVVRGLWKVLKECGILFLNLLGLWLEMAPEFILALTSGVRIALSKSSFLTCLD